MVEQDVNNLNEDPELDELQAINYARELSSLYRSEKEKRLQLESANQKLKIANEELSLLRSRLEQENNYLREEVQGEFGDAGIIGESPCFQEVLTQIIQISQTDAPVLIEGETGTGKELIARAIHEKSRRKDRPLIKVNCPAVPHELFESEFFGHMKGAFTGAISERMGRFQLADSGTLFLDEVSEIPLGLQSKLLRVLQEGCFEKVGDDKTRKVDVRIIAASNRNFEEEMEKGRFRKDLYYRLGVALIFVPPLRERKEDIPLLANHFREKFAKTLNRPCSPFSAYNIEQLQDYDWPGNIRELQNVIERALIVSVDGNISFDLKSKKPSPDVASTGEVIPDELRKSQEKENVRAALEKCSWKIYGPGGAAEMLGVQPATLAYRIKKMGLKK
ncbi:MAG: AAA family ATPase [Nitrospinae bacterium]|nr:AAA family ATPase [Nitrospinota bacterium]